MRWNRRLQYY